MPIIDQPTEPFGALVVYSFNAERATTIYSLDADGNRSQAFYAQTQALKTDSGKKVYAALFPNMSPGNYEVIEPGYSAAGIKRITIFAGKIIEVRY